MKSLDRLIPLTFPGNKVVSYQYDAAGNRTRITYPDGKTVDYAYDDANRMSTVTDWLTKVTGYSYDDAGRLTSSAFPTGVTEARTYNEADQLATIVATKGGNTLTSFTYTLDNAGLRTAVQDPSGTESYTYDNLYRLTGATYTDTTTQSYTYDAVGNRLTKVQGGTTNYTYDNGDRMTATGGVSYTYDNNGNQTGRGADTFAWDYENRMSGATVSGTSASYTYRGDGLRHSKTVGGNTTTYTWDVNDDLPVVLQDGTYTFVYGLGLISQTDGSGAQSYFLGNGLGSTEVLTDGSGNVIATYEYDVFGAVRSSSGSGSTEYKFTGEQDDATVGYYYLRARYYDPAIGRFLAKDLVPAPLHRPQALNDYVYVANDPTDLVDPSGLWCPKNPRDCIPRKVKTAYEATKRAIAKALTDSAVTADLVSMAGNFGPFVMAAGVSCGNPFIVAAGLSLYLGANYYGFLYSSQINERALEEGRMSLADYRLRQGLLFASWSPWFTASMAADAMMLWLDAEPYFSYEGEP